MSSLVVSVIRSFCGSVADPALAPLCVDDLQTGATVVFVIWSEQGGVDDLRLPLAEAGCTRGEQAVFDRLLERVVENARA